MAIIEASISLKCKLLSGTFMEVSLRWYMSLPRTLINSYKELVRKLIHQFSASCLRKISTTNLLNILQGASKSLRDYLEATPKVVPPDKQMFVGAFYNWLKERHFNGSLAQKAALSLAKVVTKVDCYIKCEEKTLKGRLTPPRNDPPVLKALIPWRRIDIPHTWRENPCSKGKER